MAERSRTSTETSRTAAADEPAFYNISQAAARLGVSRVSIWRWIRDGELAAARIGHRTTRIGREDLEGLLLRLGAGEGRAAAAVGRPWVDDMAVGAQPAWNDLAACEHFAQFYENDVFLVSAVADFIGDGLRAGEAGLVIATEPHRLAIDERLEAQHGLDLAEARAAGCYESLDARETLGRFVVGDMPEPTQFAAIVGSKLEQLARNGRRVRAVGEMVALLARDGNSAATVRLEELWNELSASHSFSLLCAYPMGCLGGEDLGELLREVCAQHARVLPTESFMALDTEDERLRVVTALQQKAESLEAEVAQRKQAEQQLKDALDLANSALRARDEFLSIAAHELKTPITSLKGHAQLALRWLPRAAPIEKERLEQALQTIDGQAGKLSRLLSQLFDLSQLDAGKLLLDPRSTDLVELVAQTVDNARLSSDRHEITVEAPPSIDLVIDPMRIEQVLANLLDNAIKYSPGGGRIGVAIEVQPSAVELSVQDQGLGIPGEQRAHIFDRFYQAHGHDHRSGMGLGLYVSRHIVESHGGKIRAEFPESGGTRFVVRLPCPYAAADSVRERLSA
jgi:excisionase family DNA binding protein